MNESGSFPTGTEYNPFAPWNMKRPNLHNYTATVSQTLSKYVNIESVESSKQDVNWKDEYHDNDHYTPLQLIEIFKRYLEQDILRFGDAINKNWYKHLVKECSGWVEDDYEIIED